jgi:HEAT repeat protein
MLVHKITSHFLLPLTGSVLLALAGCNDQNATSMSKEAKGRIEERFVEAKPAADPLPASPQIGEGAEKPEAGAPRRADTANADEDDDGPTCDGKTVRAWIAQLLEGDVKARLEAAEVLGGPNPRGDGSPDRIYGKGWRTASGQCAEALGEAALKDKSTKVRRAAISSLERVGGFGVVPALVNVLVSGDNELRRQAIPALTRAGSRDGAKPAARKAIPALVEVLKGEEEELRLAAVTALGTLDDSGEALPALLEAGKVDDQVGKVAWGFLARMSKAPPPVVPALRNFLADPEPRVRLKAVEVLCDMGEADAECVASLLEVFKRRDSQVREQTARLLCRYGSAAEPAVPTLIEVVRNDPNPSTRCTAISALVAVGPAAYKAAVPALAEVVRRDSGYAVAAPDVCQAAINALGTIGPDAKAAVPALKAAENDYQKQLAEAQGLPKNAPSQNAAYFQGVVRLAQGRLAAVRAALNKIGE